MRHGVCKYFLSVQRSSFHSLVALCPRGHPVPAAQVLGPPAQPPCPGFHVSARNATQGLIASSWPTELSPYSFICLFVYLCSLSLPLNSQTSQLILQRAGITGIHHCTWLEQVFLWTQIVLYPWGHTLSCIFLTYQNSALSTSSVLRRYWLKWIESQTLGVSTMISQDDVWPLPKMS